MTDLTSLAPLPDDETLGRIVDAALPLLGIAMDPAWRADVIQNLKGTATAARLFLEFPLPDELEPAPRFEP